MILSQILLFGVITADIESMVRNNIINDEYIQELNLNNIIQYIETLYNNRNTTLIPMVKKTTFDYLINNTRTMTNYSNNDVFQILKKIIKI